MTTQHNDSHGAPPARIVFGGSPEFAVPCLAALADSRHEIVTVLTQPDRRAGRGRRMSEGPVKRCALERGLTVLQPASLRADGILGTLQSLHADLMVIVAYGQLLPPSVLEVPRLGCINVHASLLPRWRGASPIQAALLAGDARTGISIMQMEAGLDTGPVFATRELDIAPDETAETLHDRLAPLGAELLLGQLDSILAGAATPVAQPDAGATYAGRIQKSDAVIDWAESAPAIDRRVRAFRPWPVAETRVDGERLRVWATAPAAGETDAAPGTIVDVTPDGVVVATGDGVLQLTEVQMSGRSRMPAAAFARGRTLTGRSFGV